MIVNEMIYSGELNYKSCRVLSYEIYIPYSNDVLHGKAFNNYNKKMLSEIMKKIDEELYDKAIKQYDILDKENSYAPIEIKSSVDLMFSDDKFVSLFTDVYYSLGAEGDYMKRYSQTWNNKTGALVPLKSLFSDKKWKEKIMLNLNPQIKTFEEEMGISCYPEWNKELNESLERNRYYLTEEGIVIYVPQGHMASDIWGIPTFLVEYKNIRMQ